MVRARNIKPGFFANEDLAECEPLARLLFAGLWCLADREGRLEDRPKRIRAELLPYDSCDADDLLNQLQARGFILRYSHGAGRFIQVLKFDSHQNPHMKEAKSSIPAPGSEVPVSALDGAGSDGALEQHEASTRQAPDKNEKSPAESGFLIPDSGFSDPLSPQPPKGGGARRGRKAEDEPAGFARFWSEWPASDRKGAKGRCQEAWSRHGCEAIADEIIAHIVHKRDTTTWAKNRGEFVEAPLVYLNQRRWEGAEPAVAGGNGPAAMGFDIGSDAYLQANSKAAWWREAGFANVWEAASARCWHTNAHKFRDGKLIPATQEETA